MDFPSSMSKEIEPIDEPMNEIEHFRKIISFLERKINEEVEVRRDL